MLVTLSRVFNNFIFSFHFSFYSKLKVGCLLFELIYIVSFLLIFTNLYTIFNKDFE